MTAGRHRARSPHCCINSEKT